MGDHYDLGYTGHGRKGLLDVLIIPLVSRRLMAYANDKDADFILGSAAFIVGAPLEIARFALGVSLTVALTPVAYVGNMISSTFSHVFNYFKNMRSEKKYSFVNEEGSEHSNDSSYNNLHKKGLTLDKPCDKQPVVSNNSKPVSVVEPAKQSVQSRQVLSSAASDDYTPKRNTP